MSAPERRFTVSGIDDQGDVHSFATDDAERAEGMRQQFAEDLEQVELVDGERPTATSPQ